eukprot:scaffold58617_cov24-Cyclotella_meneghiniana.AAC.1
MQQQERSASYLCSDYLSKTQVIGPSHRLALCQWGYKTIAAFSPAERALNDVVICQLAFVTSLLIALKIHAGFNVESDFVAGVITRNAYGADEINSMELEILRSLSWKLNGPTPHDFIDYFLEVMPGVNGTCLERIRSLSKTLVELAVTRYDTVMHLPSEIALASIFCATYYLELQLLADSLMFLQTISGVEFREDNLRSLFQTMICLVRECYVASEAPPLVSRVCSPPSIMEDI